MPSVQMYIKDHPEYAFTGNYFTTHPDKGEPDRIWFEILKERQPVEAFKKIAEGEPVYFVSPDGATEEMLLINETASHITFSSQA
ncbi:hypothetical protein [Pantoea sp.]|uniref:hypothetical protein n=1 Tax=Pantoea sp. TaxID=69393 RepID=UPI00289C2FDD|nr:hypothetical protein [Pantoea sp.]